ncbi:MAG: response regulator, partial [Pontiellaceae bacterium]|nr:response regulator [Pontiellaceae bacterium]
RCVLIVENDPVNQKILTGIFQKLAVRHNFVQTRQDALTALSNPIYNAVLIDCDRTDLDCYELVKTIRETETRPGQHLPVLFASADVLDESRMRYAKAGVDALLAKPYVFSDVSETMREILQKTV